ncbi:MAG: TonB C-terminal domain-containing protein [Kiritimatiellae bacterium]|nr:TonB C-terminal domain-containing protein [Kiritimatiellia bacterium]
MDVRFRKSLKISTIVHTVLILGVVIAPLVANWWFRRQRRDIVVIDLTIALPDIPADVVEASTAPQPPAPEPPKDIPEEIKPKPRPQVQKSTKRVTREPPKPDQPKLSPEEIRKLLAAGAKISDRTSIPSDTFPEAWYYALVKQAMYDAWNQPSGPAVPAGLRAIVLIRVEKSGMITRRTLAKTSGNALMDDSVMKAVNAVSKLRPLPEQWGVASKDIDITFDLSAGGL